MYVCTRTSVGGYTCAIHSAHVEVRGQLGGFRPPSTTWVLGIELGSQCLKAVPFICWPIIYLHIFSYFYIPYF